MEINTDRCLILPFEEKDIDGFMKYRNNDDWMKYQGFKGLTKEEYIEKLIDNNSLEGENSFEKGKQLAIINKISNDLIGDVYLKQENNTFWIGYTINPIYSRQGYAYEVALAVIKWIKGKGEYCIKAGVLPENIPSINLLKKLEFTYLCEEDDEDIYVLN